MDAEKLIYKTQTCWWLGCWEEREREVLRIWRWIRCGVRQREVSRQLSVVLTFEIRQMDVHPLRRDIGGRRVGGRGGGQLGTH